MLFPGVLALIALIVADLVRAPLRLIWLAALQLRRHGHYYLLGIFPLAMTDRYLSHPAGIRVGLLFELFRTVQRSILL